MFAPAPPLTTITLACALVAAFLAVGHAASAKPRVTGLRVGDHPGYTRLVIDISQRPDFQVFMLSDPYRVVVDLPEVDWRLRGRAGSGKLIGAMRYGLYEPGNSRVVIEVRQPVTVVRSEVLPGSGSAPHRVVFDLKPVSRSTFLSQVGRVIGASGPTATRLPAPNPSAKPLATSTDAYSRPAAKPAATIDPRHIQKARLPAPPASVPLARPPKQRSRRKPSIVLDPGHGGRDSGASGTRTVEKHITLDMALELRDLLARSGRYRVLLTRTGDRFVALRDRVETARAAKADLFISIHADSIRRPDIRGMSVYTLSEKASDKEAAALAARENKADLLIGVNGINHLPPVVQGILVDLSQGKTNEWSRSFARSLTRKMRRSVKLLPGPNRSAGFAVLKAPDVPSVLLEMGYISNRREENLLTSPAHRKKIADAILRALDAYFDSCNCLQNS